MKPLATYLLELLICSGVLLLAYTLLLEGRTHFRSSRLYLLGLPVLSILIPLLRIPVWPAKVVTAAPSPLITLGEPFHAEVLPSEGLTTQSICIAVYLIGVALIIGNILRQMPSLRRLRRNATIESLGPITVVRTLQPIAPFSFFGSIYVWQATPAEDLKAILAHETSHITHRHSLERIAMESMKSLLWWNPFIWLTSRLLIQVEEFEADHDALRGGLDTQSYMSTIFRQLFGYSPDIANGLRNSFTQKRFLMMTKQTKSRYGLLRLAGLLPAVLGLLCAFSFTSKASLILPASATPSDTLRTEVFAIPQSGDTIIDNNTTFLTAEVMPKFQDGGLTNFRQWTQSQIKYPAAALEKNSTGRVVVSFVIERDGSVSNIMALQSPDQSLTDEALRVVASSPKWTPGTNAGTTVRVKYTLPIDFRATTEPTPSKQQVSISIKDGVITKTTTEVIGEVTPTVSVADENTPFLVAEVMPKFQNGDLMNFRQWTQSQIKYPTAALEKNITGRVVVSFVIERDGSVSSIESLQSPDQSLTDEALRVLTSSPKWTPGTNAGTAVRVKYTLPIDFRVTAPAPQAQAQAQAQ